jgi:cytochrome c6
MKKSILNFLIFFFNCYISSLCNAINLEKGEQLFKANCVACHNQGINIIIPEKNLERKTLEANGMYNLEAIRYQISNGKNGMPAFGGRLKENEIEEIGQYVLIESEKSFQK